MGKKDRVALWGVEGERDTEDHRCRTRIVDWPDTALKSTLEERENSWRLGVLELVWPSGSGV